MAGALTPMNPAQTTYSVAGPPTQVGAPQVGQVPLDSTAPSAIPFRIATDERSDQIQSDSQAVATGETQIDRTVPGTGFVYGFEIDYNLTASGNSANVAYQEDAPYIAASSIIFRDVTGEIVDVDGWSLKQCSRYIGLEPFNQESSLDTTLWVAKATGTGSTAGGFRFKLKVPVGTGRRTLLGLLGNQDRGQSYVLRANLAASGAIYSTAPTAAATAVITRVYESYTVPNSASPTGQPQQVIPPYYGVLPQITRSISSNPPIGGSTVSHYLQRLNTTFRALILVFRSNSSRATAETNLPTNVLVKLGSQIIFNEPAWYRREKMWDRYGWDAPSGLLCYDMIHDFDQQSGAELGHDWWWTQQLAEAQFNITYPSGFGSTANTLTIITADLVVPDGMNLYAA